MSAQTQVKGLSLHEGQCGTRTGVDVFHVFRIPGLVTRIGDGRLQVVLVLLGRPHQAIPEVADLDFVLEPQAFTVVTAFDLDKSEVLKRTAGTHCGVIVDVNIAIAIDLARDRDVVGNRIFARDNRVHVEDPASAYVVFITRSDVVVALNHKFIADRTAVGRRTAVSVLITDIDRAGVRDASVDHKLSGVVGSRRVVGRIFIRDLRDCRCKHRVVAGTAAHVERTAEINLERRNAAESRCPGTLCNFKRRAVCGLSIGRTEENAALFNVHLSGTHSVVGEINHTVARFLEGNTFGHALRDAQRVILSDEFVIVLKAQRGLVDFVSNLAGCNEKFGAFSANRGNAVRRNDNIVAEFKRAGKVDCRARERIVRRAATRGLVKSHCSASTVFAVSKTVADNHGGTVRGVEHVFGPLFHLNGPREGFVAAARGHRNGRIA